jgi:hypothetical protein
MSRTGCKEFLVNAQLSHSEWSVVLVKAPVDKVCEALSQVRNVTSVEPEVHGREISAASKFFVVTKSRKNDWTVIYESIFWLIDVEGPYRDGEAFSEILKTAAIVFIAEDTSGAIGIRIFDSGEMRRDVPDIYEELGVDQEEEDMEDEEWTRYDQALHEIIEDEGAYIPACNLTTMENKVLVEFVNCDDDDLERVDMVFLDEESPFG